MPISVANAESATDVPTHAEFTALEERVTALETAAPPEQPPIDPPVDPPTGDRTKVLLDWLRGLQGKHIVCGQYHDPVAVTDVDDALHTQSGEYPALTGEAYWRDWDQGAHTPADVPKANARYIHHWNSGGLCCHNGFLPNPSGAGGTLYPSGINPQDCITPGTAQYNALHASYDQEIAGFLELQTAGVVLLFRPFLENRWASFWWGVPAHFSPSQFQELWRQRRDYYESKGLHNIIWVLTQYVPESFPAGLVDIHGEDCYSDNIGDYLGYYNSETAAHPDLPWAAGEWGSGTPTKGGSIDLNGLIESWKSSFPKAIYFMAWSGHPTGPGWALCQQQNTRAAMANDYCLPLSRLGRPL
jgi:mannan endo-1,4-beta-mannosidase